MENAARIRWACRRGMLELDLFLMRFFENRYAHLTEIERQNFSDLLTYPDPDLFQWFMGYILCSEVRFQGLIADIRAAQHN